MVRRAAAGWLAVVATAGLVVGCAVLPEDLGQPPPAEVRYPGVHLPVGGMDSVPVGTTDTYLVGGHIQTQDPGSGGTFSGAGRACQIIETRLYCK